MLLPSGDQRGVVYSRSWAAKGTGFPVPSAFTKNALGWASADAPRLATNSELESGDQLMSDHRSPLRDAASCFSPSGAATQSWGPEAPDRMNASRPSDDQAKVVAVPAETTFDRPDATSKMAAPSAVAVARKRPSLIAAAEAPGVIATVSGGGVPWRSTSRRVPPSP